MLYVLCGIPASGKTTLGNKLSENAILHSYDDVPLANTKAELIPEVMKTWISGIKEDLKQGKSVVIDNTNITRSDRLKLLHALSEFQCKKVLHFMNTPLDECLKRNASRSARLPDFVIIQSHEFFEYPTLDEGWDEIIMEGVNDHEKHD